MSEKIIPEKPNEIKSTDDIVIKRNIKVSLLIISFSIILIVYKYKDLPNEVPLFYSLPWGEKQLADKYLLFILPLITLLCLSINTILAKKFKNDFVISKLLITGALLFSVLSIITLFKIIFLIS